MHFREWPERPGMDRYETKKKKNPFGLCLTRLILPSIYSSIKLWNHKHRVTEMDMLTSFPSSRESSRIILKKCGAFDITAELSVSLPLEAQELEKSRIVLVNTSSCFCLCWGWAVVLYKYAIYHTFIALSDCRFRW